MYSICIVNKNLETRSIARPIDIIEKEIEREKGRERFIMQEVVVRSTTAFLFIGLIDFRLSPSNAPDVFGLKTIISPNLFLPPDPYILIAIPWRKILNLCRPV